MDYRGYGLSQGTPAEAGLYRDGLAIYDAARERGFPPERIVLHGESLGCAVAVEVALARPSFGVVLETPFLSVPALARKHYPFVPGLLIRSRFDAASKIDRVTSPKLFLVAERDEIAPAEQGRALSSSPGLRKSCSSYRAPDTTTRMSSAAGLTSTRGAASWLNAEFLIGVRPEFLNSCQALIQLWHEFSFSPLTLG